MKKHIHIVLGKRTGENCIQMEWLKISIALTKVWEERMFGMNHLTSTRVIVPLMLALYKLHVCLSINDWPSLQSSREGVSS